MHLMNLQVNHNVSDIRRLFNPQIERMGNRRKEEVGGARGEVVGGGGGWWRVGVGSEPSNQIRNMTQTNKFSN